MGKSDRHLVTSRTFLYHISYSLITSTKQEHLLSKKMPLFFTKTLESDREKAELIIICNRYYGFTSDLTLGVMKMPWFTIMTVIVVILAVFGLIALAKYLVNYSKKRPLNNIYERICLNRRQILLVYVLRNHHIDDWIPNLVGPFRILFHVKRYPSSRQIIPLAYKKSFWRKSLLRYYILQ